MKRFALALVTFATFTLTAPGYANSGPNLVLRLTASSDFVAPLGFQIFCLRNASACRGGGSSEVALTEVLMKTLKSINSRVNRAISPASERQDIWEMGVKRGDCEDYVLAKRAQLIRDGVPGSALRIAVVTTRQGERHAVLVVRTTSGDFVLDNLAAQIRRSDQTSHSWVAMTMSDGRSWKKVNHS